MPVKGLTSYILNNYVTCLKECQLSNCTVIIDGNDFAHEIYGTISSKDFGGDYAKYYEAVKDIIQNYKKCNIKAIVVFVGSPTSNIHAKQKRVKLKSVETQNYRIQDDRYIHIPSLSVIPCFLEVLRNENVEIRRYSNVKLTVAITKLAAEHNGYIIGGNSDFYIFPMCCIHTKMTRSYVNKAEKIGANFVIKCELFDQEKFLTLTKLQHKHLVVMGSVLSAEFNETTFIFKKFWDVLLNLKTSERIPNFALLQVSSLIDFMKGKTPSYAVRIIEKMVHPKYLPIVQHIFEATTTYYNNAEDLEEEEEVVLPLKFHKLYLKCELPRYLIDMKLSQEYYLPVQIESDSLPHSNSFSIPIIQEIYGQLMCYQPLKIILACGGELSTYFLEPTTKGLQQVLQLNQTEIDAAKVFPNLEIFLISLLYYKKVSKLSECYFHSILLSLVCCQISNGMNNMKIEFTPKDLLELDCFLEPLLKCNLENYNIDIVHTLNAYQSILHHVDVLNTMMDCPFKPMHVAHSYSGTLMYNLYKNLLANENDVLNFIKRWAPQCIYTYYMSVLTTIRNT